MYKSLDKEQWLPYWQWALVSRWLRFWYRLRSPHEESYTDSLQGRAGLVALRRSRGEAVGALGKAFYKGGFEPKMNKREASLILQLRYATCVLARESYMMGTRTDKDL